MLSVLQFFAISGLLNGQLKAPSDYVLPIKNSVSFSGGFGELRRNHFHTGLDFRTAGQIGIPVHAVKDGYVARISVSPSGYGLALYLVHSDGHTSVYGHLSRFQSKLEQYVEEQQYRIQQFAVDLNVPSGLFSFKKGEIVAWSGNSGSSGGPHLHFEIRETQSERPQNPLFYLPGISDKSAPRINSLYLYTNVPGNSETAILSRQRFETIGAGHRTTLKVKKTLVVSGQVGFGFQADDDFNGTGMKCGIYSAELMMDQEPVFSFKVDHLAFDMGRYINSHIDYEEFIRNKRWIHRLFLQPGNKMDIYQVGTNKGVLQLQDSKIHEMKLVVSDAHGNKNVLAFNIIRGKETHEDTKTNGTKLFYWDRANEFQNSLVKVELPAGSLYENLSFLYTQVQGSRSLCSAIHKIHNTYVPVHQAFKLSIKTLPISARLQSKALVVMVDPTGKFSAVGGDYVDGWVTARPRVFGNFAVALDTVPPKIQSMGIRDHKTLVNKQKIDFRISDNLSGIASYRGEIDGNWVLFSYDAKSATISFPFDKKRIVMGKTHSLKIVVEDAKQNRAEYNAIFYL
jgi:hypothetical protein